MPEGVESQIKENNREITSELANHTRGSQLDEAGLEQKGGSKTIARLVRSCQPHVRGQHFITFKC